VSGCGYAGSCTRVYVRMCADSTHVLRYEDTGLQGCSVRGSAKSSGSRTFTNFNEPLLPNKKN
jgi:hypothetical protein